MDNFDLPGLFMRTQDKIAPLFFIWTAATNFLGLRGATADALRYASAAAKNGWIKFEAAAGGILARPLGTFLLYFAGFLAFVVGGFTVVHFAYLEERTGSNDNFLMLFLIISTISIIGIAVEGVEERHAGGRRVIREGTDNHEVEVYNDPYRVLSGRAAKAIVGGTLLVASSMLACAIGTGNPYLVIGVIIVINSGLAVAYPVTLVTAGIVEHGFTILEMLSEGALHPLAWIIPGLYSGRLREQLFGGQPLNIINEQKLGKFLRSFVPFVFQVLTPWLVMILIAILADPDPYWSLVVTLPYWFVVLMGILLRSTKDPRHVETVKNATDNFLRRLFYWTPWLVVISMGVLTRLGIWPAFVGWYEGYWYRGEPVVGYYETWSCLGIIAAGIVVLVLGMMGAKALEKPKLEGETVKKARDYGSFIMALVIFAGATISLYGLGAMFIENRNGWTPFSRKVATSTDEVVLVANVSQASQLDRVHITIETDKPAKCVFRLTTEFKDRFVTHESGESLIMLAKPLKDKRGRDVEGGKTHRLTVTNLRPDTWVSGQPVCVGTESKTRVVKPIPGDIIAVKSDSLPAQPTTKATASAAPAPVKPAAAPARVQRATAPAKSEGRGADPELDAMIRERELAAE